jgi:hypothetical protein
MNIENIAQAYDVVACSKKSVECVKFRMRKREKMKKKSRMECPIN